MLVLSRQRGEAIVIGNGVRVTVLEVRGERVKLGFAAPPEMPIHREEVFERIEKCRPALARAGCVYDFDSDPVTSLSSHVARARSQTT